MPLANWRLGRGVPDISSPEISRRVERQTISLKEGGYEDSTWNKAGTAGPGGGGPFETRWLCLGLHEPASVLDQANKFLRTALFNGAP